MSSTITMSITDAERKEFAERLGGITFAMYRQFPFFALLAESCSMRISRDIPTACVDAKANITFNPDFCKTLTDIQFIFVLTHEVLHVALGHFHRKGSRDMMVWNMAGDFAINLMIRDALDRKDSVCEGSLIDDGYAGMSAEQIYESLMKNARRIKVNPLGNDMKDGNGDDKDDSGDGSVLIRGNRAKTPEDASEWQSSVASAATRAKQMGKLPASIEREVDGFLKSKVDWREQLRQRLRSSVSRLQRDFYTFMPPNRRFVHQGLYFPSLVGYDAPRIGFAIDTSGSMTEKDVTQAHAEIDAIRKQFGCSVYVMSCDADVQSGEWIAPHQALPMPKGGGGTDFRPVFQHIIEERIRVDTMVYLTDGYGTFGDDPRIDTIWVMTTHEVPPWGSHIQIGVDA